MGKLNAIIEQIKQPSTIKGLLGLAAAIGLVIDPTQLEKIVAGVLVLQGLVNVIIAKD